jgi:hypothetical protein
VETQLRKLGFALQRKERVDVQGFSTPTLPAIPPTRKFALEIFVNPMLPLPPRQSNVMLSAQTDDGQLRPLQTMTLLRERLVPIERTRAGVSAILALLLLPVSSLAQTTPSEQEVIAQLVQQIQQLQEQDRDLQERLKILEAKQAQAALVTQTGSVLPSIPPQSAEQSSPSQMPSAMPPDWHALGNLQWHGFGEVDYKVLNQRLPELGTYGFVPGSAGNFYTGDFGLFLTSRLTNKTSVLSEIVFEEGDAQSYTVHLRRMLLKYDYNDHLKMSFGRYQTNIGYYNWAFRSAAWLQTTSDRPLVMEYARNGGLLPTQAVGVSVTGAIPSGRLGLNYVAEYGSSDTVRPDIDGDSSVNDENNGNQVNLGFFLRPDTIRGLQIGASYYHDKISNFEQGPSLRFGQSIVNGYIVYVAHGIEFLNEGFLIRDVPLHSSESVFNTPAFYTQLSKQLRQLRPFFRYQYVNASSNNSFYNDVGLRYGPSFGARYDANDYIAFKAQLDHTVRRGEPDLNGLHLQFAFTF